MLAAAIVAELITGVVCGALLVVRADHSPAPRRVVATGQARAAAGLPATPLGTVTHDAPDQYRTLAVRTLLDARAAAVLHRDKQAFLAGIDPDSPAFRAAQSRLFDNLAQVPLGVWRYQLDPTREEPLAGLTSTARYGSAPVWMPQLELRYSLAGFDQRETGQQQYLTFVQRSGRWYIASDSDLAAAGEDTARNLWDFGPVVVVRTAHTLVLGHPSELATMATIPPVTDAAVPRITAVWGADWPQQVVVLVPSTQTELSRILANGSDLSRIAAVATADLAGTKGKPSGERVIVNPPNYRTLGAVGRRIVLTHEMTHVASRAVTGSATPTWLAEGFADYVGYLGTGVPVREAATELGRDVRAGRMPTTLPGDGDFDGTNPEIAQAYEQAWLACRLIAARIGQAGLVRFYRQVGGSARSPDVAVAAALHDQLHLSAAQFITLWQATLRQQLE